ncbi:MAG: DUF4115 domain-containing protein, partial [Anaerolineales bacterium]|nr:DUF4115 domain-containing protein [Anaerolineales bacterium]
MNENFIKNTPLFAELTDEEQRAIGKRLRSEDYQPNESVFIKGGESSALYLVKEGWVKLSADDKGPVVANLGPGSLLGETDFFLGRPYALTARATGNAVLLALDNNALANLIAERPEIGLHLGLAFGAGIAQYQKRLAQQLADIPLLENLSDRERSLLAQHLTPQRYFAGEAIYRSGDLPTGLFFIEQGTVRLLGETDADYTELADGEAFGEMAVLSNKPHSNTAQAAGEVILWQLSPTDFAGLTESNPSIKSNLSRNLRSSLSAADQSAAIAILKRIPLFKDLPRDALGDVARLLLLRHIPAGETVFSQGDPGEAMYIVDAGSIEAITETLGRPRELVGRFVDSDYFGETVLLTGKTRSFTAYATAPTNLWGLYRTDFDHLLVKYPQLSVALSRALRDSFNASDTYSIEPHLKKVALLGGLSRMQLDELSARLQPRRYQPGSAIYYEGRSSDEMYFIERGQVEHWANTMQGPLLLETLGQSDFFGEIALLSGKGHPTTAYALVETDIWVLTKSDFDDFLHRYPALAVTFTRILSERLEQTMSRLRGSAPQRGLPPGPGPTAPPPFQPGPPSSFWSACRPGQSFTVHAAGSASSSGFRPDLAAYASAAAANSIAAAPPIHSQHTQAIQPVPRSPQPGPSPHSQFTQGMPPQRPPVHSQNTMGMPPVRPGGFSQPTQSMPVQRPEPAPARGKSGPQKRTRKGDSRPASAGRSRPVSKQQPSPARREKARQPTIEGPTVPRQPSQPLLLNAPQAVPQPRREESDPRRMMPRSMSNRRIGQYRNSFSVWFAKRSLGAKLRLLAVLLIIIWLCGIMAPSWIIQVLAANFEDNGALPGDSRSIVNQVRQDGAVGAMAALPFVETATPTPSNTPTPTETPTPLPPTETPTPIIYGGVSVELKISKPSWIQILVDDAKSFEGILQPGESRNWTGQSRVAVRAGNAGGVEVIVNGTSRGLMGADGQVVDQVWEKVDDPAQLTPQANGAANSLLPTETPAPAPTRPRYSPRIP